MKSLYESILANSKAGKSAFDEKPVNIGGTTYEVSVTMKDWLQNVSLENFIVFIDTAVTNAKVCSRKGEWDREFFAGIYFRDGYFKFRFFVQSINGAIYYTFYFSDSKKNRKEEVLARTNQIEKIDKVDRYRLNTFKKYSSNKDVAKSILEYLRRHLNIIEKQ